MSNRENPAPTGIQEISVINHHDILMLTEDELPGPVGLKNNQAKQSTASLIDQILAFVRTKSGRSVGNGECFDLADHALRNARAKTASDYGTITPTADYVWGKKVSLSNVRPGFIVQFRNYRYDRRVEHSDGSYQTEYQERPHHTAVVDSVGSDGMITVLEQNAPPGSSVHRSLLYFSNSATQSNGTSTTVAVTGRVWFYQPQRK